MDLTIGVDVGGTKIAAGAVDPDGRIVDQVRLDTPGEDAEAVEKTILVAITTLSGRQEVQAVGLAIAGFVDETRSVLRFAPNLPMADRPLRRILTAASGLDVVVENDANAAAWGEYRFGGGAGSKDMVAVTLGTGVGGGIILRGDLVRGAWGAAAELGHVRVVPEGLLCGCGKRGCWEQYASGRALVRLARELARDRPRQARRLLELADGDPDLVTGLDVATAAVEGDPAAVEVVAEIGRWLGQGVADIAAMLDPEVAVIGGGVSELGDLLLVPAREAFAAQLSAGEHRPHLRIEAATLGNEAGLIGAADLARHR